MKGYVTLAGGGTLALPEFTAYSLRHTDGTSADSFEVSFPTRTGVLAAVRKNRGFYCMDGSTVAFCGVIDEIEVSCDNACLTTLCGRGMAALLMDNQVEGAEFYNLDLDTVLSRYVRPYGISSISVQGGPWRTKLVRVGSGCTCQKLLQGFCLHAGAPRPRFLPNGTLCISAQANRYAIGSDDILTAARRFCRYGVKNRQKVLDLTARTARTAEDAALTALDIHAQGIATRSGAFTDLTERTAAQRLYENAEDADLLELVLPGNHGAQPCDTVSVTLACVDTGGEFTVREVCRRFDGNSIKTELILRAKER